jgi:hypothetical protein
MSENRSGKNFRDPRIEKSGIEKHPLEKHGADRVKSPDVPEFLPDCSLPQLS